MNPITEVPGLYYKENAISKKQDLFIKKKIKQYKLTEFKYKSMNGGYYQYIPFGDTYKDAFYEKPQWIDDFFKEINLVQNKQCNNCFVISYDPGTGLNDHTDDFVYGEWVLGLTLGSGCTMNFKLNNKTVSLYLNP